MGQISSMLFNNPGMGTVVETAETAITWGPYWLLRWWNAVIAAAAVDTGNTNMTYRLRPGLVMGIIASSGQWTNYSPTAADGSEVAMGVLVYGLRMQDVFTGTTTTKFSPILIAGGVKGGNLLGLDGMARAQMSPRFIFDDELVGRRLFPFNRFVTKTSNYQILSTDNQTEFNNATAGSTVTFTLPAIASGLVFGFRGVADQTLTVASLEGSNMVAVNNASASSVTFSTGSQKIGGGFIVYSNPAGTKWYVALDSAGTTTVTVA